MKRVFLLLWLPLCLTSMAQKPIKTEDKVFNFGSKVGLNSAFPVVNSLTMNGVKGENISTHDNVGISASAFFRLNIDRFFIQPSFSWNRSTGDILFNLADAELSNVLIPGTSDQLHYNVKSLTVPVLIGYKFVKEGPYGLSFMVGPNIKYSYDIRYTPNYTPHPEEYTSTDNRLNVDFVTGIGMTIWRFFFDVSYEFGLNQKDTEFKYYNTKEPIQDKLVIDKHTNGMSFSLGFLF